LYKKFFHKNLCEYLFKLPGGSVIFGEVRTKNCIEATGHFDTIFTTKICCKIDLL